MHSRIDHLPSRFPVGTRYVVEGRGSLPGRLRIQARYLEFPDGRHVDLPVGRPARARPRRGRRVRRAVRK